MKLYQPCDLGAFTLQHRVVQAPITLLTSDQPGDLPDEPMARFYGDRASDGGLQVTGAAPVSLLGRGYFGAPGIYSDQQISGWKRVADSVHDQGGKIFLQLSHVGRQSHTSLTGGDAPVAPSAVQFKHSVITKSGLKPVSSNRALKIGEVVAVVDEFRRAALRSKAAGFDGVEIHGSDAFLIDQFLQSGTNKRTDRYGGSVENRARFLLEVTDAAVSVLGPRRVGVRLSPGSNWGGISDANPAITFGYAAEQLNNFDLAYLHVVEPIGAGLGSSVDTRRTPDVAYVRKYFRGTVISAGGFDKASAERRVEQGDTDLVAFGRLFLSNPDLANRLRCGLPLAQFNGPDEWDAERFASLSRIR